MPEYKYTTRWREAAPLPSGLKGRARASARSLALSALSSFTSTAQGPFLNCLYCHYVFEDQRARFDELITQLKRIGSFVDAETCVDMLEGRVGIDGRYFHLSFDDGFRNVFTNAIPILGEHGVPATIFVPTNLLGADWDRTRHYCLETTRYRGVIEMVTWEDLKEIQSHGFEVGSHTRNHRRFVDISSTPDVLRDEILGSKQDIEEHLQTECRYISWPYGTVNDADEASLDMARKAGYRAVFGAFRGSVIPGRTDVYSVPRHHFEVQWPLSHVMYFAGRDMGNRR